MNAALTSSTSRHQPTTPPIATSDLSERAVDNARQDLGALLARCTEEVEAAVHAHHGRLLAAARAVEDVEDGAALLRNYANGLAALTDSLQGQRPLLPAAAATGAGGGAGGDEARALAPVPEDGGDEAGLPGGARVRAIEGHLELLLRELDTAVAARDVPAARALLAAGDDCLALLDRDAGVLALEVRALDVGSEGESEGQQRDTGWGGRTHGRDTEHTSSQSNKPTSA